MSFESPVSLIEKLIKNKKFRDAFVYEQVKTGIPYQMRAIRKERKWKQGDMGEAVGKPRNVINRLENPSYGKLTLKTLFEIASGCEVALLVKFVPFSRLLKEYEDVSFEALSAPSVTDKAEVKRLQRWASRRIEETTEPLTDLIADNQSAFRTPLARMFPLPIAQLQQAQVIPIKDRKQRQQETGNESRTRKELNRAGALSSDLADEPLKRRLG